AFCSFTAFTMIGSLPQTASFLASADNNDELLGDCANALTAQKINAVTKEDFKGLAPCKELMRLVFHAKGDPQRLPRYLERFNAAEMLQQLFCRFFWRLSAVQNQIRILFRRNNVSVGHRLYRC